jgi:hypothetical protein
LPRSHCLDRRKAGSPSSSQTVAAACWARFKRVSTLFPKRLVSQEIGFPRDWFPKELVSQIIGV